MGAVRQDCYDSPPLVERRVRAPPMLAKPGRPVERSAPWHTPTPSAPPPAEAPLLTIVDVGHQLEQILAGSGWLSGLLTGGPMVVLVARATVPGLRRLESSLHLLAGVPVAAVVGPPLRRWPRPVRSSVGRLTGSLIESGRLVQVPEDRQLAALGITPRPLPGPLLGAAGSLFALAEGTPDAR